MTTIAQQLNVKEFPFEIRDSQRRTIYYENSYGRWYKSRYGSQGREIYFENSGGYWWKREYDSNGKEIYFEDSNWVIFDNRPKPCEGKTVEIDGVKYKLVKE